MSAILLPSDLQLWGSLLIARAACPALKACPGSWAPRVQGLRKQVLKFTRPEVSSAFASQSRVLRLPICLLISHLRFPGSLGDVRNTCHIFVYRFFIWDLS